jgi:hypothetical protein
MWYFLKQKYINNELPLAIGRIFVGYNYREGVEPQRLQEFCYQIRKIKINLIKKRLIWFVTKVHEIRRELNIRESVGYYLLHLYPYNNG